MATIPSGRGDLPFAPPPLQTYSYPGLNVNDSQSSRIIGTCVTLIVISTIVVALRFVARHLSRAGLWWDDWTILAALITSYGANICTLAGIPIGFGRHVGSFGGLLQRINVASSFFKLFYAYEIIYGFSIALAKISILLFYSRIFKDRLFRWALWITYGLVGCFTFAVEVAIWAQCQPTRAFWDLSIQPRNCVDLRSFFIGSGVPNIILNFIILVLPLPMVWTLEIERKHKLALSGVFLLGGFIVIVSIIRVAVLARTDLVDITWVLVDGAIWTTVEPTIAVVSACLPIMRSLWIWNREKSEARRSQGKGEHAARAPPVDLQTSKGSLRVNEKPRRFQTSPGPYPLNELPGDVERGWATKTEINSDYTSSTLRANDSPAQLKRGELTKSPDHPRYADLHPSTAGGRPSNGHSRSASEAESSGGSSTANLKGGGPRLPIQRTESPPVQTQGHAAGEVPLQDLSGAYFPWKTNDREPNGNEPAELYGSEHVP